MNKARVNEIIKIAKVLVDQVALNMPMDEKMKEMEYLAAAGMISYYGYDYAPIINRGFQSIKPKLRHQDFNHLMLNFKEAQSLQKKVNDKLCLNAFIHREINDFANLFSKSSDKAITTELFISDFHLSNDAELLQAFINRMNQYINSVQVPAYSKDGETFFRTGVKTSSMKTKDTQAGVLEETFNKMQSEEIMGKIFELSQFAIDDEKMATIFNNIRKYKDDTIEIQAPYKDAAKITESLYQNPEFHNQMKEARITGNFETLEKSFDNATISGGFEQLCTNLDGTLTNNLDERNLAEKRVQALIQTYIQNQKQEGLKK